MREERDCDGAMRGPASERESSGERETERADRGEGEEREVAPVRER